MRIYILFISLFMMCSFQVLGQYSLYGTIQNELGENLVGATVVALSAQDSVMESFAISNYNGEFLLDDIDHNHVILQLSFIGYANESIPFEFENDKKKKNVGVLTLRPSSVVLQEVSIKSEHIPMGLRGDTISYNASAFKTKPGATVEDLLKKLPGVEVDRDGGIKAQGKDVENVLVDGKEFFGEDPTIATRNLGSEAVDKVQVFDKKSDMAEFTGVDDGNEEKTINLKLKEGYKSGGFGNVELAKGTENTYKAKLSANRFSATMQSSILASINNINERPFSFGEYMSFMGGLSRVMANGGGGMRLEGISQRPDEGRGIVDSYSAGLNLNYDFSKKTTMRSHYFFGQSDVGLNQESFSERFDDNRIFMLEDDLQRKTRRFNHRGHLELRHKPNPTIEWGFSSNLLIQPFESKSSLSSLFFEGQGNARSNSDVATERDQFGIEATVDFKKRFEKKGRNILASVNGGMNRVNENLRLSNLFENDQEVFKYRQNQIYENNEKELSSSIRYMEPLGKLSYLSLMHRFESNEESPSKEFFDVEDLEEVFNENLSAELSKNYIFHQSGLAFKRNAKRVQFDIGLTSQWTGMNIGGEGPLSINRDFQHFLPELLVGIELTPKLNFELEYGHRVNVPPLLDILTMPDNSNPYELLVGNPKLIPELERSAGINMHYIDEFNFTNLFGRIEFNHIDDRVVRSLTIGEDLRWTIQPINAPDYIDGMAYISFSSPLKPLGIKYRIDGRSRLARYSSLINNEDVEVFERDLRAKITLENRKAQRFNWTLGVTWNYMDREYPSEETFGQEYFDITGFVTTDIELSNGWAISSSMDWQRFSQSGIYQGRDLLLWGAELSKAFMDEKLIVYIRAHDLLGNNRGIDRQSGLNYLEDVRYNTIGRYIMFGAQYRMSPRKEKDGLTIDFD